jgi:hypothetical protein
MNSFVAKSLIDHKRFGDKTIFIHLQNYFWNDLAPSSPTPWPAKPAGK